jgi:hypothetical protein
MRYCSHCRRLNPGRPQICHYCGRTWRVRLCPRHHENPPSAQYCGNCGSVDLSETAGRNPISLIIFKVILCAGVVGLFCGVGLVALNIISRSFVSRLLPLIVIISILMIAIRWLISFLPGRLVRSVRRVSGFIAERLFTWLRGILRWIWEI